MALAASSLAVPDSPVIIHYPKKTETAFTNALTSLIKILTSEKKIRMIEKRDFDSDKRMDIIRVDNA